MSGLGLRFYEPPIPAILGAVEPKGPAALAGLASGDEILAINGEPVHDFLDLQSRASSRTPAKRLDPLPARRHRVRGARPGPERDAGRPHGRAHPRAPAANSPYPPNMLRHIHLSLPAAFVRANIEAWNMTALQARLFGACSIGEVSIKNLSGPLSIAEYAGDSAARSGRPLPVFPRARQSGTRFHESAADPDTGRGSDRVSGH